MEEQFKVVAEAYYVLSDKFRRCEYDLRRKGYGEGARVKVQGSGKAQGESSKVKGRTRDVRVEDLLEEILRYANEEYYKVDRMEYAVRFGCGGLLGVVVVMWLGLYIFPYNKHSFLFLLLAGIGVFGLLSAIYGDKFWNFLFRYRRM